MSANNRTPSRMLASYVYSTDTIADRHIQQEGRNTNTEGNAGDAALVRGLDQDMEAMTDVAILRNAREDQQGIKDGTRSYTMSVGR